MNSDRLVQIKQILFKEGKVNNEDLCRRFGISMATVRRDLDKLEREGLVRRIYGGAQPVQGDKADLVIPQWQRRKAEGSGQKEAIAMKTAGCIPENCTVFLDGGTTVYEVAKCLVGRRGITVITNSLRVAALLAKESGMQVYCIGGRVKSDRLISSGLLARESINFFGQIDLAVFSADGFLPGRGLTEYSMELVMFKKNIIAKTDRLIVALDSSKFGKSTDVASFSAADIHTLITDAAAPAGMLDALREQGVRVIIADN